MNGLHFSTHTVSKDGRRYNVFKLINDTKESEVVQVPLDRFQNGSGNVDVKRLELADTLSPILCIEEEAGLTILDGRHRVEKAKIESLRSLPVIFVSAEQLASVEIRPLQAESVFSAPHSDVPVPDFFLSLSNRVFHGELDGNVQDAVEDYFIGHLPTAVVQLASVEVRLERPKTPDGVISFDPDLKEGFSWWKEGLRLRDHYLEHVVGKNGLICLDEAWVALSYVRALNRFKREVGHLPDTLTVIHLDDHTDMMSPRLGLSREGVFRDFITGQEFSKDDENGFQSAIISDAIGKGSMMMPLIHTVRNCHIRHLCERPLKDPFNLLEPFLNEDSLKLGAHRLDLKYRDCSKEDLNKGSDYTLTNDILELMSQVRPDGPIFLHIDMDYFSNPYDGSSDWEHGGRQFDPSLEQQLLKVQEFFNQLEVFGIAPRVKDVSIGISPGFFPARYWKPMVLEIIKSATQIGIDIEDLSPPFN